jgi:hypothetical protein
MATISSELMVLRATLRAIDPPIWRHLAVASDIKLSQLHAIMQAAFGWEDCHLHEFQFGRERALRSAGGLRWSVRVSGPAGRIARSRAS